MQTGVLTISLDFELYWGVRDKRSLDSYRANLAGVAKAIPQMLALFEQHQVHATWATVGLLFCRDRDEALSASPAVRPRYANERLSPYGYMEETAQLAPEYHFAPALIERIAATPGQEVASHTFSHYYCRELGQTPADFRADLAAAQAVAQRRGQTLRSLVFPRNQWNAEYLSLLTDAGIDAYRGNERGWLYAATDGRGQGRLRRMGRLLDTYLNLSGQHTYSVASCAGARPLDFPASRFLRPFDPRLAWLEGLRLRRIRRAMRHAARRGEVFHLWWHPHNFGTHTESNLRVLGQVLDEFGRLRDAHGMRSLSMAELADSVAA